MLYIIIDNDISNIKFSTAILSNSTCMKMPYIYTVKYGSISHMRLQILRCSHCDKRAALFILFNLNLNNYMYLMYTVDLDKNQPGQEKGKITFIWS